MWEEYSSESWTSRTQQTHKHSKHTKHTNTANTQTWICINIIIYIYRYVIQEYKTVSTWNIYKFCSYGKVHKWFLSAIWLLSMTLFNNKHWRIADSSSSSLDVVRGVCDVSINGDFLTQLPVFSFTSPLLIYLSCWLLLLCHFGVLPFSSNIS